jgi:predicted transcriptional regulator
MIVEGMGSEDKRKMVEAIEKRAEELTEQLTELKKKEADLVAGITAEREESKMAKTEEVIGSASAATDAVSVF